MKQARSAFGSLSILRKTQAAHEWLERVIRGLQPFSIVKNVMVCRDFKWGGICHNTLQTYMTKLFRKVGKKIQNTLLESFAVVFDNWSAGPTHYVSDSATFPANLSTGQEKGFLGIEPIGKEL